MVNRTLVGGLVLVLLVGCASTSPGPGTGATSQGSGTTASASGSDGAAGGNGTLFTSLWDTAAGTRTITSHPVGADGSIGAESPVLSGPADDTTFPAVVDGTGPAVLTGTISDYWTTDLQVRQAGTVTAEVAAPRWCGGEGLAYNPCILLDDTRIARTTELGRDPESGGGPTQSSIIVSSLADGSTLAEFPVTDLTMMLATTSPDHVLIVTAPATSAEDPSTPSTVMRMDLTDGTTSELGVSPAGWVPLCPIGDDSVLGFPGQDLTGSAVVVGPAQVADVTWDQQDTIVGCSSDGRYLYVQRIPQPPTGEVEDTEAPNPPTALERITLADGSRTPVLTLEPGWTAGPVTRQA